MHGVNSYMQNWVRLPYDLFGSFASLFYFYSGFFYCYSSKRNTVQQIHQRPLFTDSVYCFRNGWTQQFMNWLLSFSKWLMNHCCWLREKQIPHGSAGFFQISLVSFISFISSFPIFLSWNITFKKPQTRDHWDHVKRFWPGGYWLKVDFRKNQQDLQILWGLRWMRN